MSAVHSMAEQMFISNLFTVSNRHSFIYSLNKKVSRWTSLVRITGWALCAEAPQSMVLSGHILSPFITLTPPPLLLPQSQQLSPVSGSMSLPRTSKSAPNTPGSTLRRAHRQQTAAAAAAAHLDAADTVSDVSWRRRGGGGVLGVKGRGGGVRLIRED